MSEFDALSQEGVLPDKWKVQIMDVLPEQRRWDISQNCMRPARCSRGVGVTWAQAAQAARDLIDYADSKGIHSLYTAPGESDKNYTPL